MTIEVIDVNQYKSIVKSNKPSIVLNFADWCGHCHTMKPIFQKVSNKMKNVKFYEIDAHKNSTKLEKVKINGKNISSFVNGYPTLLLFNRENVKLARYNGPPNEKVMLKQFNNHFS